jgi:hypothetical protein
VAREHLTEEWKYAGRNTTPGSAWEYDISQSVVILTLKRKNTPLENRLSQVIRDDTGILYVTDAGNLASPVRALL